MHTLAGVRTRNHMCKHTRARTTSTSFAGLFLRSATRLRTYRYMDTYTYVCVCVCVCDR
jgi:hypothetical protein